MSLRNDFGWLWVLSRHTCHESNCNHSPVPFLWCFFGRNSENLYREINGRKVVLRLFPKSHSGIHHFCNVSEGCKGTLGGKESLTGISNSYAELVIHMKVLKCLMA